MTGDCLQDEESPQIYMPVGWEQGGPAVREQNRTSQLSGEDMRRSK